MTMRDMARDIETPEQARAMIITAGPAAAHMALMIIERCLLRADLAAEHNDLPPYLVDDEMALMKSCVEAWKAIYAFRGI